MIKDTPSPAPSPVPVFVPADISTKSISSSTADLLFGWVVKKSSSGKIMQLFALTIMLMLLLSVLLLMMVNQSPAKLQPMSV